MKNPPPASGPGASPRAATPIAFIRAIALGYRRYGIDPTAALCRAGIDPALMEQPEARVTAGQMEIMSEAAMRELDDEALGWFSRRLPWGSYGMLCRASLGAPNLGVALKRWCRHHRLLTDDIGPNLEVDDGQAHRQHLPAPAQWGATAEQVAKQLHMSVRALRRQLKEEGASLQQLKDAARRDQAIALLDRSRKPVKQISALVGFASEKSFSRAFRTWTGMPPQAWRARHPRPAADTPGP